MGYELDDVSVAAIEVLKKAFARLEQDKEIAAEKVAAIVEELAIGLPVGRKYDPLERALVEIGKRKNRRTASPLQRTRAA